MHRAMTAGYSEDDPAHLLLLQEPVVDVAVVTSFCHADLS